MDIKDIILNYRQENKISQREFARRCALSNSLISLLEMGENPQTGKKISPDLITYRKLANGMGISVQALFEKLDLSEPVSMSFGDAQEIMDTGSPKTTEARILANGIDKLPKEQREKALAVFRLMFEPQFAELFTKGKEEDDT